MPAHPLLLNACSTRTALLDETAKVTAQRQARSEPDPRWHMAVAARSGPLGVRIRIHRDGARAGCHGRNFQGGHLVARLLFSDVFQTRPGASDPVPFRRSHPTGPASSRMLTGWRAGPDLGLVLCLVLAPGIGSGSGGLTPGVRVRGRADAPSLTGHRAEAMMCDASPTPPHFVRKYRPR